MVWLPYIFGTVFFILVYFFIGGVFANLFFGRVEDVYERCFLEITVVVAWPIVLPAMVGYRLISLVRGWVMS